MTGRRYLLHKYVKKIITTVLKLLEVILYLIIVLNSRLN